MMPGSEYTLARHKARQIIRQRYRDAGRKVYSISIAELHRDADEYLNAHPELVAWACAALTSLEQKSKARKSRASLVQISGAK